MVRTPAGKLASNRAYHARNKERIAAQKREYYTRNKARIREQQAQKKYGVTPEQTEELLTAQGFKCAICHDDTPGGSGDWHIDHCHASGAVRGLLCSRCNTGLGQFRDNTTFLANAIAYLDKQRH